MYDYKESVIFVIFKFICRIVGLVAFTLVVSYFMSRFTGFRFDTVTQIASILILAIAGYSAMGSQRLRTDHSYNMTKVLTNTYNQATTADDNAVTFAAYRFSLVIGITGIITLIISATILYSPGFLTNEQKLDDLDYLYSTINLNHPNLYINERVHGVVFSEEKEIIKENIQKLSEEKMGDLTDSKFAIEIRNLIRTLNDNTHLVSSFHYPELYGKYTAPNNPEKFILWSDIFTREESLNWYGFSKKKLDSQEINLNIRDFRTATIVPEEVAYLRLQKMDTRRIEEDGKEIRAFLERVKDFDKLIIDIRGEVMASDEYWMKNLVAPLIEETLSVENYFFIRGNYTKGFYQEMGHTLTPISSLDDDLKTIVSEEVLTNFDYYGTRNMTVDPLNPVGFKGEIYLLVDNNVNSSTENFAFFAKESGFATLVGETTGGNGHTIEPILISLPNSGIIVRYVGELILASDGTVTAEVGTIPHGEVDATISAPSYSRDKAIQYIISNGE